MCFSDEYQSLVGILGGIPLLHTLADHLQREASHLIKINQVLLHANVPLIKAEYISQDSSVIKTICIDISIDGPSHSGLATTELVLTLVQALPPLGPVVVLFKEYFNSLDLSNTYMGGIVNHLSNYSI